MPRLPPRPHLDWSNPAAPRSLDLGDVYFSGDGLAEKRAVFVGGCGLPEGWLGREHFTIGELGFGAGLALLAAWDAWRRRRPSPTARLSFLSFEGWPLAAADAARIHASWPEVADLSAELLAKWPVRARGAQRIDLGDGVSLTLFIDDVAAALPEAEAQVDAWFLDGFAPSKNPDMWSARALAQIARLSAPGARAATYTVAGDVRRALEAAGFDVEKRPGVGRKKERLEATLRTPRDKTPVERPARVLIVGAGVAGACAARAFLGRDARVTVVDQADHIASAASGNAAALVTPRLDAVDSPVARAALAAWLRATRIWETLPNDSAQPLPCRHRPRSEDEARRFARLLADPPLDETLLQPLDATDPSVGLLHPQAFAIRPAIALPRLMDGADVRLSSSVVALTERDEGASVRLATGDVLEADLVVVCAGMGAAKIGGLETPPLQGRLGQVESAEAPGLAPGADTDGGYVATAFGRLVFGATFEPAPEGAAHVSPAARDHNLAVLARLRPNLAVDPGRLVSRTAVRATTPDRLPFAGPAQRMKAPVGTPAPSRFVRLIGGLGSRGFLWAPLLAELVASEAFGEPIPLARSALDALLPDRFLKRALRRAR